MGNLKNRLDVLVAFGVIGIILMIIIPLPSFLLDILLVVNITLSVLILLMTLFSIISISNIIIGNNII